MTGGLAWGFMPKEHHVAGHERMEKTRRLRLQSEREQRYENLKFDKKLTFDKVTDVFHAAVAHDEDQPSHLHILDTEICATRCAEEYGNPCQRFCPAAVYEMEENAKTGQTRDKSQFFKLRSLQNLRHRRSVSNYQLGYARRRRRSEL